MTIPEIANVVPSSWTITPIIGGYLLGMMGIQQHPEVTVLAVPGLKVDWIPKDG